MRRDLFSLPVALILSLFTITGHAATGRAAIEDLRIAFERNRDRVLVREMIALAREKGDAHTGSPVSYEIPLPAGAVNAQVTAAQGAAQARLDGHTVWVEVPDEGCAVQLMYELPIRNGVVALDQPLKSKVTLAHAALVGFDDQVVMKGNGFTTPESRTTPDGIPARFSVGENLEEGHIQILLSGFQEGTGRGLAAMATLLSFGMLSVGLYFRLRRRVPSRAAKG